MPLAGIPRQNIERVGVRGKILSAWDLGTSSQLSVFSSQLKTLVREQHGAWLMRADLGFPCLLRETLSKNAVLSGLTYSYCNSVSQAGGVATRLCFDLRPYRCRVMHSPSRSWRDGLRVLSCARVCPARPRDRKRTED